VYRLLDQTMMSRALSLAEERGGGAHPNPRVGCVITRGKRIVGEGWHERFGGPHAEILALRRAGVQARGATMYVTLEPCPHWGKTPPCAEAVARAGVARVVVAVSDPSRRLTGRGIAHLRRAGVRVDCGLLREKAVQLNPGFFSRGKRDRPWVILKMAQTLDGKIASRTGASRWITGPRARALGHQLRAASDAVLVGGGTVRRDNPGLTSHGKGVDPVRVVLSRSLRLPVGAKVFRRDVPVWVLSESGGTRANVRGLENAGVSVIPVLRGPEGMSPRHALVALARRGVNQLLVEGGGRTAEFFLSAGMVDEVYLFVAPFFLGGREAPTSVDGRGWASPGEGPRLHEVNVTPLGDDYLIHGYMKSRRN
jgi:diaminohydroxyphosphoribosylaminopyrimidine deaminase/5-amino-6-(5-phosphoribosylamino)uracil reductase